MVSARGGLAHQVLELDENPGSGSASERTSQSRQLMLPVGRCQGPGKLLSGFLPTLKYTFVQFPGTKPALARNGVGAGIPRGNRGDSKRVLRASSGDPAKATKDPMISAAILDKAADLKSQVDEPITDCSPRAPDVQPEK